MHREVFSIVLVNAPPDSCTGGKKDCTGKRGGEKICSRVTGCGRESVRPLAVVLRIRVSGIVADGHFVIGTVENCRILNEDGCVADAKSAAAAWNTE